LLFTAVEGKVSTNQREVSVLYNLLEHTGCWVLLRGSFIVGTTVITKSISLLQCLQEIMKRWAPIRNCTKVNLTKKNYISLLKE
jgi:hypothetical protein